MNINDLLKLLRKSLYDVTVIKNAVKGNIYPHYINQSSKLPCITFFYMGGSSPSGNLNAASSVVQCKIWTTEQNPNDFLYDVYENILSNFHQAILSDGINVDALIHINQHQSIMQEMVEGNIIFSLPFTIKCKSIHA